MAAPFQFEQSLPFSPDGATEILRTLPALPGVFALHGPSVDGQIQPEPYLTRAADLRRRITRILAPPEPSADGRPAQSKRLNLRSLVARIEYTITGSEFESTLTLYHASASIFGLEVARRRLKLRTPFFLRFTAENAYPRVYSTNRLSKRALDNTYGPFPSRAAAERYLDAVLDLFKLRRCYEDLAPYPEHPGCVYQEMKKCLAPCNQACTPEGAAAYEAEAAAVKAFFDTRGESMIIAIGLEREEASAAMEFERAAALHTQWHKIKAAQSLADELVQPIPKLRAIVIQKAAQPAKMGAPPLPARSAAEGSASPALIHESEPAAAVFLVQSGCIAGPERLSTLGVRAVKEQTSVGSSLFAQPLMLQAIPLADDAHPSPLSDDAQSASLSGDAQSASLSGDEQSASFLSFRSATESYAASAAPLMSFHSAAEESALPAHATETPAISTTLSPELRATNLIAALEEKASTPTDLATLSDHLSLLRRWYYRPEKQRTGEVFFPKADGTFPKAEGSFPKADGPLPNLEGVNKAAWPIRRILNGAARMSLGDPKLIADTQRDLAQRNPEDAAQKPNRTKILHEGRPDVERTVPILDKPPTFKSRRKLGST